MAMNSHGDRPQRVPLPRVAGVSAAFDADFRRVRRPAILAGATAGWPALRWSPEVLRERCGELPVEATVQLPDTGVPYLKMDMAHRRAIRVADFVDLMAAGAPCYLDQLDLGRLPGLESDCRLEALVPTGRRIANLWVGARTRSGLHYDPMDNYLVQLFGEKRAILVAPDEPRRLYPFPDNTAKSRIDPEAPDLKRFPKFGDAVLHVGTLVPGDALYIPRGWWHFLHAPEQSISMNLWHDPALRLSDELRILGSLGPPTWLRVARDFVWHGLMGRAYARRLYSPPPTGKLLYDLCAMLVTRPHGGRVAP